MPDATATVCLGGAPMRNVDVGLADREIDASVLARFFKET